METHDFIIVGGESAGAVLAARLSEDSKVLLQAGGRDRNLWYHLPAGFAKMTKGTGSLGWQIVPQKHMRDMVIRYTQALVTGGGSSINAQIYTRGNALDYDEWRQMDCTGCTGWGCDDVRWFRKADDNSTFDNRYHGTDIPRCPAANPVESRGDPGLRGFWGCGWAEAPDQVRGGAGKATPAVPRRGRKSRPAPWACTP